MTTQDPPTPVPTQKDRWLKYGLNLGVLLLALFLILFVVNFAAFRHHQRIDFTHNRRYTLSPQTLRLLGSLDRGVTITTLYRAGVANAAQAEKLAEVDNLLAEYRHRGKNIATRHIDPTLDLPEFEKFRAELLGRYADEIAKRKGAIEKAKEVVKQLQALVEKQPAELDKLAAALGANEAEASKFADDLKQAFQSLATQLPKLAKQIDERSTEETPDFEAVRTLIRQPLPQQVALDLYSKGLLEPAITEFNIAINKGTAPDAAKEQLIALRNAYRAVNKQILELVEEVDKIEFGRYEEVRSQLMGENCVVIALDESKSLIEPPAPATADKSSPDFRGVTVLSVDELYPQFVSSAQTQGERRPEQSYKGEEAITSALFKLTLEHKTRVVFVNASPQPVLMRMNAREPGASYQLVAQRLRAMNFQVEEWQPGDTRNPQPNPVAAEGETLVLIVLPAAPNPSSPINIAEDLAMDAVKEHLEAGGPALVMSLPTSTLESAAQPGPLTETLAKLGVEIERSKLILRPLPGQDKGGIYQLDQVSAASDHPVAMAVRGLPGRFLVAQPVKITEVEGTKAWALMRSGGDSWVEADAWPWSREKTMEVTRDATEPGGPVAFAVAAEKGKSRVVVIAEPVFASDANTAQSSATMSGDMEVSLFSLFPANAELFVNSVYWLANLDDLIAPGARTQETRRVDEIGTNTLTALRWMLLGGLPIACLAAGVVVWFVRRK